MTEPGCAGTDGLLSLEMCSGVGATRVIKRCALCDTSVIVCKCVCLLTVLVFITPPFWGPPGAASSGWVTCALWCRRLPPELSKVALFCPLKDNRGSAEPFTEAAPDRLSCGQDRQTDRRRQNHVYTEMMATGQRCFFIGPPAQPIFNLQI